MFFPQCCTFSKGVVEVSSTKQNPNQLHTRLWYTLWNNIKWSTLLIFQYMYLEIVLDQQHVRLVSMYFISSCLASLKDSWMKGQKASILCIPSNKFEKSSIYSKKDNYVRTMLCCSRNNKILLEWRRVWMLLLLLTPNKILPMEISLGSW